MTPYPLIATSPFSAALCRTETSQNVVCTYCHQFLISLSLLNPLESGFSPHHHSITAIVTDTTNPALLSSKVAFQSSSCSACQLLLTQWITLSLKHFILLAAQNYSCRFPSASVLAIKLLRLFSAPLLLGLFLWKSSGLKPWSYFIF